jgi:hypothetical protein
MEGYCCPKGLATGILLESVVNRLCKLARASLDEVCTFGKKGLCSLVEEPFGLNALSASGDRRFGNRSSSMRPLSVFRKAISRIYMLADLSVELSRCHIADRT